MGNSESTQQESNPPNNYAPSMQAQLDGNPIEVPPASANPEHPSASQPQASSAPKQQFVHPLIKMIDSGCSASEMINTLNAYVGFNKIGTDENGKDIYDMVDQTQFMAPILEVFSYCATNGNQTVVEWLMNNFVPLQVSYDNNFVYFECLRWNHFDMADLIATHESFYPSMEALENLLSRGKYQIFKKCMESPYLTGLMRTYRFTFMYYADTDNIHGINSLLAKIKQRQTNPSLEINDEIYPNPRLAKINTAQEATEPSAGQEPSELVCLEEPAEIPGQSACQAPMETEFTGQFVANPIYQGPVVGEADQGTASGNYLD